jgi:hypothetical protein
MFYIRFESNKAKTHCVVLAFAFIAVIVLGGGFAVFWLAYKQGQSIGLASFRLLRFPVEGNIPSLAHIDIMSIIPPSGSGKENVWISSILYVLASQYKYQAVTMGNYKRDYFLELSQIAFMELIREIRSDSANVDFEIADQTEIHPLVFSNRVKSEPYLSHLVFPYSACLVPGCVNDKEMVNSNPIEFALGESNFYHGINQIKKAIFTSKAPVVMPFSIPETETFVSCESEEGINNSFCVNGIGTKFVKKYNNSDLTDTQLSFADMHQLTASNETFFTLIGYNDDYEFYSLPGGKIDRGGFIARPSYKVSGHTMEYLLGRLSEAEENYNCPNPNNEMLWTPATENCVKEVKNISMCSRDYKFLYNNGTIRGAVELKCTDEDICDKNATYALLEDEKHKRYPKLVFDEESKTLKTELIELKDGNVTIMKPDVPFQNLHAYFKPIKLAEHNKNRCGYIMLPYSLVRTVNSISNFDIGAFDLPVTWHSTSFNRTFDSSTYKYVLNSTAYYQIETSHPELPEIEL